MDEKDLGAITVINWKGKFIIQPNFLYDQNTWFFKDRYVEYKDTERKHSIAEHPFRLPAFL